MTARYIECDITLPTSSPYTTPIPHIVAKMFALAFVVGRLVAALLCYVMLCYVAWTHPLIVTRL